STRSTSGRSALVAAALVMVPVGRAVAMGGSALLVRGRLERTDDTPSVLNLLADRLDRLVLQVAVRSRDFR
ncbi:MAG: error-prone polymerase, partial [Pseudonocardia sp.]|nr:error-prone polymerase [Pseudonocardia sp.]